MFWFVVLQPPHTITSASPQAFFLCSDSSGLVSLRHSCIAISPKQDNISNCMSICLNKRLPNNNKYFTVCVCLYRFGCGSCFGGTCTKLLKQNGCRCRSFHHQCGYQHTLYRTDNCSMHCLCSHSQTKPSTC